MITNKRLIVTEPEFLKFYVIGDSHVRSLSTNRNFFPIYIGSGNAHCFVSFDRIYNLLEKILYLKRLIPIDSNVILFFGEPDTRYALGMGWRPWEKNASKINVRNDQPEVSAFRLIKFVDLISKIVKWRIFILSVPPTQCQEQISLIKRYNSIIKKMNVLTIILILISFKGYWVKMGN